MAARCRYLLLFQKPTKRSGAAGKLKTDELQDWQKEQKKNNVGPIRIVSYN
jgi:hypothetical protein